MKNRLECVKTLVKNKVPEFQKPIMMMNRLSLLILLCTAALCFSKDTITPAIRKVSEVKTRARRVIERYSEPEIISYGILDVTKPPYSVDNTGVRDVTAPLQQAIIDARDAQLVCYLPAGRYKVSDTLEGIIGVIEWDDWPYAGYSDPWVAEASFHYPCVLAGSSGDARTRIVLRDKAPGFDDPSHPKPVIYFWARSMQSFGPRDPNTPQGNINFNQKIMSLDIDLGRGNPGAIGIDHRGAEGATIEDIRITANGAFAGLRNAPGSGGAMHGIEVTGGRYGLYLSGSQPSPLVSDVKLIGQTEASILCRTRGPLTIVGAEIGGAGIQGQLANAAWSGAISLIDSIIRLRGREPVIDARRSVVMDNVWLHRCERIAVVGDNPPLMGDAQGWTHVRRYVAGGIQNYPEDLRAQTDKDPIWVDRRQIKDPIVVMESSQEPPPQELLSRHKLPNLPDWANPDVVNVKTPLFNAKGDGKTDDTNAIQSAIDRHRYIFLPKGRYCISKPLRLRADTALFGLTNILTQITSIDGAPAFSDVEHPRPLIETLDCPEATTSLQMMTLDVPVTNPCVYALHWKVGDEAFVRNIYPIRPIWHPHAIAMSHPMVRISGSGGGRWYTQTLLGWWSQGPDYRHLLVEGTSRPLRFYHLQPQHARSEAMIEFRNARNIDVYSMKAEGDVTIVWLNRCRAVRLFGYGGNASPSPGRAIFRLDNCSDIQLINVNPQMWGAGKWGALGVHYEPESWNILRDASFTLNGMEQFALYQLK